MSETEKQTTTPKTDTDKLNEAAIPREYGRRFESNKELKAFLDEKELLKRLPVSRRTIHNWRTSGKIPSIKIGRRILFCWENVSAALRRMERGGE